MKLAEALVLRADCQKRIEQLRERLVRSAKVQEGEKPPENPSELLQELNQTIEQFTDLVKKINKTNSSCEIREGMTLTDALAERDALSLKRSILYALVQAASVTQQRYSKSEVKFFSTVDVGEFQKQVNDLSKEYRELDTKIQETNWKVDLVDR